MQQVIWQPGTVEIASCMMECQTAINKACYRLDRLPSARACLQQGKTICSALHWCPVQSCQYCW